MKEYITIYKCRLCGKIFALHASTEKETAFKSILSAITGHKLCEGISPTLIDLHSCENGDIGVADLLGIK